MPKSCFIFLQRTHNIAVQWLNSHVCPKIRFKKDDTEVGKGTCAVNIFQLRMVRGTKEL